MLVLAGSVVREGERTDLVCQRAGPQHASVRAVYDGQTTGQGCEPQLRPGVPSGMRLCRRL